MCISCSFPRIISLLAVSVITGVSISSGVVDLSFLQAEKINKKMANEAKVATAAKSEKNGLSSIFTSLTIPLCIVVGIVIYKFVMGNPANFEGGDPANHPISEGAGQVLGLVYKGGFIVPILLSLVLMNITFSIERYLTLTKASGKGRAEMFVGNSRL